MGPDELFVWELVDRLKEKINPVVVSASRTSVAEKRTEDEYDEFLEMFGDEESGEVLDKDTSGDAKEYTKTETAPIPIELIMATSTSMEGESTAMYLTKLIRDQGISKKAVNITRIARGIPVGGDIEYADDVTLTRAMEGRSDY